MTCVRAHPTFRHLRLVLVLALALPAGAAEKERMPRFVSLRSDEVNLRTGPGERYPIDWVLVKKGLPVELIDEYDVWRRVRDWQGSEGWVHQRMVAGVRTVIVTGKIRTLHADAADDSTVVARVEPGVIARLLECRNAWCRVEAESMRGWLRRSEVWGVYPDETLP
jgi:SH3-like domain-containing protein